MKLSWSIPATVFAVGITYCVCAGVGSGIGIALLTACMCFCSFMSCFES